MAASRSVKTSMASVGSLMLVLNVAKTRLYKAPHPAGHLGLWPQIFRTCSPYLMTRANFAQTTALYRLRDLLGYGGGGNKILGACNG